MKKRNDSKKQTKQNRDRQQVKPDEAPRASAIEDPAASNGGFDLRGSRQISAQAPGSLPAEIKDTQELTEKSSTEPDKVKEEDISDALQAELQKKLQECSDMAPEGRFYGHNVRAHDAEKKKTVHPVKVILILLAVILALMILAVAAFAVISSRGKSELLGKKENDVEFSVPDNVDAKIADENTGDVIYKGKKYCYNDRVTSILCMGVDREELNTTGSVGAGDSGQADSLFLLAIDTDTGETTMIGISRDSMVDVNVYSNTGSYLKTDKLQLCLAYTYGDGREMSCENTVRSVSRLLYGIPINSYAAIDLSAIPVLNDAVGGVEVTVLEDLTIKDPSLTVGDRILLRGQQAEWYVRSRLVEEAEATADANNLRMERQKQYLSAFARKVIDATKADMTLPITLYNVASDYMVTDVSASKVAYLASLMVQKGFDASSILTVPGKSTMGETYAEFHVDEEALYEMILDVFYIEQVE